MRLHRDIFRLFTFLLCLKIGYILLITLAAYLFPSMNAAVFFRVPMLLSWTPNTLWMKPCKRQAGDILLFP